MSFSSVFNYSEGVKILFNVITKRYGLKKNSEGVKILFKVITKEGVQFRSDYVRNRKEPPNSP